MNTYIIQLLVRPKGSLGTFHPSIVTVKAIDDKSAVAAARAVADERGWDCDLVQIIRREAEHPLTCVICKQTIAPNWHGWAGGNNPEPISLSGRCCDECDNRYVVPARIVQSYREH